MVGAGRGEGRQERRDRQVHPALPRNSSEHVAAKAKITDKALERLEANAVDKPWESWDLRMEIAAAPRGGAVVARLTGGDRRRGDRSPSARSTSQIHYGERVALLGANGSGKTTLLDAALGRLPLDVGRPRTSGRA